MISNDAQLNAAIQQMQRMYAVLASLKQDVLQKDESLYTVMAEGPLEEIRQLQADIDAFTGRTAAIEHQAEIWIRVQGPNLHWPRTPTSVLTAFLDTFRKGIAVVAEFQAGFSMPELPEIRRACDLRVVALLPGSVRVGVSLPDQIVRSKAGRIARKSVNEYMSVASWVDSEETLGDLEKSVADSNYRRAVLNALRPMLPRANGEIDAVEFSGKTIARRTIQLTKRANERVEFAIKQSIDKRSSSFIGKLREIDLDALSFILRREDGSSMQCEFPKGLLQIAKLSIDTEVRVIGVQISKGGVRTKARLRVQSIEPTEP
ncbi:MAG TPA: hypothetical protein VEK08_07175 [Planctomycetota bacterium]|nr:hypothetical protein [Planctomycetota bacterium]